MADIHMGASNWEALLQRRRKRNLMEMERAIDRRLSIS